MKQQDFCRELQQAAPPMSDEFHRRIETFLTDTAIHEAVQPVVRHVRMGSRTLVIALIALLLMGTVALAATQWGIFDKLGFMLGEQPVNGTVPYLEKVLHQETIGNAEITILEAGYDGRTLLMQYSYRSVDDSPAEVYWWTDHFWIDGQCISMAANSGGDRDSTTTPGVTICTDYFRLDNENVELNGVVTIGLPLGEKPDSDYFRSLYDENTFSYAQPEQGLVLFTFDTGDVLSHVETIHPNVETVTDIVTAKASEVSFTPLMTYITLELEGNPAALEAYKAEHGEGYYDENGVLYWSFSSLDVHISYLDSLTLVDGSGTPFFPNHLGNNGMSDHWAEYIYPHIEKLPEHLYLAPMENGTANMSEAIFIR